METAVWGVKAYPFGCLVGVQRGLLSSRVQGAGVRQWIPSGVDRGQACEFFQSGQAGYLVVLHIEIFKVRQTGQGLQTADLVIGNLQTP